MVHSQQAAEEFVACSGADRMTALIILREGFDFVEIVIKGERCTAAGITDSEVKLPVKTTKFQNAL